MKVFVLMPFKEDFDDVYHIIKDSVTQVRESTKVDISCFRADEIAEPGRISDSILLSIRECDLVVAELTGNNPNVMYELGFAHALDKPAIILNQAVHDSPFDVKDFRQITYDRSRLFKECRPSLIASLTAVATKNQHVQLDTNTNSQVLGGLSSVRPGPSLTREIQRIQLELKFLRNTGEQSKAIAEAEKLIDLLGRVSVVGTIDSDALKQTVSTAGNCAVQLEKLDMQDRAEKVYRKAIGLYPEHAGVHLQYADLLVDLGRIEEAKDEIHRARTIDSSDARLSQIEMRVFLASGKIPDNLQQKLEQEFNSNPSDDRRARAYLMFLQQANDDVRFEEACLKWQQATGNPYTAKRALGDFLASSKEDKNMQRAISIYEDLKSSCPDDDLVDMLHNLATLYYHFDRDAEAETTWREAYGKNRTEAVIQSAFSQLLERKGDIVSARNVANGLPIS